jgi:hypothetical protein
VLQVLDKQGSATFSLRDMELIAVFANQAGAAIGASRVQRDMEQLLRAVLGRLGDGEGDGVVTDEGIEALVSAAAEDLDRDEASPLWGVVEQIERLRALGEEAQALLASVLSAAADVAERRSALGSRGRRRRAAPAADDDSIGL